MTEQLEIIPLSPLKRAFDVFASSVTIVALFPIILILILLMLLEQLFSPKSRGPLLYKEIRISQGKPFLFYKLRTFKLAPLADAKGKGIVRTKELEQDFRNLTLSGLILRQIYLDEFPQLFLVLFGKMTLVGPRPTNPDEYQKSCEGGNRAKTILVAGLTGRFQTHKSLKYGLNQEQVDIEYALFCKNNPGWRIVMHDFVIMLQTILTILRAEGI